jgi:signal transduction histidine kinase
MSNKNIAIGILIVLLFLSIIILFCVLVVKLYIKKIKAHNQKELAFQKTLNDTIIETQEQVLNNISQDLHDDAGQQLTYINFQLENLKLDSPALQETLAPLSASVTQLSQSVRSISHALNNQLVLQQDLVKSMAAETDRMQKNAKAALHFTFEEQVHKHFSANEKIFIYRIFQECLNNCFKHSKATFIDIHVSTQPHFKMVIADNGKGFSPAAVPNQKSMGLANMTHRASSIGYALTIDSAPGAGTRITLTQQTLTTL